MSSRKKSTKVRKTAKVSQEYLERKRMEKRRSSRLKKARRIKKLVRGE